MKLNFFTVIWILLFSIKKAVCVFYTQTYNFNERENKEEWNYFGRYISVATFEYDIKKQDWKLQYFDKNYGIKDRKTSDLTSIIKIGTEKHALFFSYDKFGYTSDISWTTIYDLSNYKNLKTIIVYDNNQTTFTKEISFYDEENYGYYNLIIKTFLMSKEIKTEQFEYDYLEGYVLKE